MATNQAATLARIEQKLDDVKETLVKHIESFDNHVVMDTTAFRNVQTSIIAIRLWQRWVIGIGSGIGFLLGLLGLKELR